MIQPARSRTPNLSLSSEHDERDMHADTHSNPATPRRKSRPKLASYLSQYIPSGGHTKTDIPEHDYIGHPKLPSSHSFDVESVSNWDPEQLITSIQCTLMADPYKPLSVQCNSSICRILEAYRELVDEKERLQTHLDEEIHRRHVDLAEAQEAEKGWMEERAAYKAEIKRLEVLMAKGKKGLVEVIRARQHSVLKKPNRSEENEITNPPVTVYEFLETANSNRVDSLGKAQRASFHPRPPSPSQGMAALSHKLSMTSTHADLPFGTPPPHDLHRTLTQVLHLQEGPIGLGLQGPIASRGEKSKTCLSDSALSAFGSHGDLLPDELSEHSKTTQPNSSQDLQSLEHMAAAIARARGLDPKDILPKLAELFYAGDSIERYQSRLASLGTTNRAAPSRANILPMESLSLDHGTKHTADHPVCVDELAGQPAVQIVPTSGRGKRRFSFEAGDDMVMFETGGGRLAPYANGGLRSKRSVSLSDLRSENLLTDPAPPGLDSYCASSLDPLLPLSSGRSSRIPSPIYNATLVKPRREGSTSSLMTAIKQSKTPPSKGGSRSSSQVSIRSTLLGGSWSSTSVDLAKRTPESQRFSGGRRFLEQRLDPKASNIAIAAARAAESRASSKSSDSRNGHEEHSKRFSVQSNNSANSVRSHQLRGDR
ncbi:hypothetical protein LTR50_002204 [Elasticomyces elasticus]|nr:hypothetical protein LTR50_002204 [Elasticomyces elasticus]